MLIRYVELLEGIMVYLEKRVSCLSNGRLRCLTFMFMCINFQLEKMVPTHDYTILVEGESHPHRPLQRRQWPIIKP